MRGARQVAMLSVNASTGQVWYHTWHGEFLSKHEVGPEILWSGGDTMMPSYGPYGPGPWGWGGMAAGWIIMLVFWGLVIVGIVVLVRVLANRNAGGQQRPDSAIETLRRRYAAGEITKEQFEEMKRTLG